jgi:hypothetical protein
MAVSNDARENPMLSGISVRISAGSSVSALGSMPLRYAVSSLMISSGGAWWMCRWARPSARWKAATSRGFLSMMRWVVNTTPCAVRSRPGTSPAAGEM